MRIFLKENLNRYFFHFGGVIAILVLFGSVFYLPFPPQFIKFGISITDELLLFTLIVLIYYAFQQSGWIWKYVSLLFSLLAFALPLLRSWATAGSTWNIVL